MLYKFTQPHIHGQNATYYRYIFLTVITAGFEFSVFPSPKLVAISKLKRQVSPNNSNWRGRIWIHAFSKSLYKKLKCKQPRVGFELGLLSPFPATISFKFNETSLILSK